MSGIEPVQLLKHVIQPTLSYLTEVTGLPMDSKSAEMILMGTQAHESHGHHWLTQHPSGPARGGYQMEVQTHSWLWSDYLVRRKDIANAILAMVPENGNTPDRMTYDLAYATAMARVRYWIVPAPLPAADDIVGMARYFKRYWNTEHGAATEEAFIHDFRKYAGSVLP